MGQTALGRCDSSSCRSLQRFLRGKIGKKLSIFTVDLNETVGRVARAGGALLILNNVKVLRSLNMPLEPVRLAKSFFPIGKITQAAEGHPGTRSAEGSPCDINDCTSFRRALQNLVGRKIVIYTNESDQTTGKLVRVKNNHLGIGVEAR